MNFLVTNHQAVGQKSILLSACGKKIRFSCSKESARVSNQKKGKRKKTIGI